MEEKKRQSWQVSTPLDTHIAVDAHIEGVKDKEYLLSLLKKALKSLPAPADGTIQALQKSFNKLLSTDKQAALQAFLKKGNEPHHFQFPTEEVVRSFRALYANYEQQKSASEEEKTVEMEENLNHRYRLIKKMQSIIDDSRVYPKIQRLREIEKEWGRYTPIPPDKQRHLQYTFFSLTRQFYKKRKIFMEVEHLNREKIFEEKTTLCKKLEELLKEEPAEKVYRAFSTLCDAYQGAGAVNEEKKQPLQETYERLVAALEEKLAPFVRKQAERIAQQIKKKEALLQYMQAAATFDSGRIDDWMEESRKVSQYKETWQAVKVGMATLETRQLTSAFWKACKQYIKRRNIFFKQIDAERAKNLADKKVLIAQVEQLHDHEDWEVALSKFQDIHKAWKTITLLPGRERSAINLAFKKAMDTFFAKIASTRKEEAARRSSFFSEKYGAILALKTLAETKEALTCQITEALRPLPAEGALEEVEKAFVKACIYPVLTACYQRIKSLEDAILLLDFKGKVVTFFSTAALDLPPFLLREEAITKKKARDLAGDIFLWKQNVQLLSSSPASQRLKATVDRKIKKAESELQKLRLFLGR